MVDVDVRRRKSKQALDPSEQRPESTDFGFLASPPPKRKKCCLNSFKATKKGVPYKKTSHFCQAQETDLTNCLLLTLLNLAERLPGGRAATRVDRQEDVDFGRGGVLHPLWS